MLTPGNFAPRRIVPEVVRRSPLSRIRPHVNFRELEMLALKRRVSFQDFVFGRAMFEHARDFIDTNSSPSNAWLSSSNLGILNDHSFCLLKTL